MKWRCRVCRRPREAPRPQTDGNGANGGLRKPKLPQTQVRGHVTKLPLTSAAHTRQVRAGRPRARRGRARLSPSRRGGSGAKSRVPPSSKAASEIAAASLQWQFHAGRLNVKKLYMRVRVSPTPKKGCGEKRRGFSPRDAKRPRGRFPAGNRRGGARRRPRRKAPMSPPAFVANLGVPRCRGIAKDER